MLFILQQLAVAFQFTVAICLISIQKTIAFKLFLFDS